MPDKSDPQRSIEMKGNAKDYVSTAQLFFTAYDAHGVDGMLGLCADGALGRYAPYGRASVVPIRGGIDGIWRAFSNAVPNFRVKVIELIPTDGNTVVIQAEMSGPIPAEVPGVASASKCSHDSEFQCCPSPFCVSPPKKNPQPPSTSPKNHTNVEVRNH